MSADTDPQEQAQRIRELEARQEALVARLKRLEEQVASESDDDEHGGEPAAFVKNPAAERERGGGR